MRKIDQFTVAIDGPAAAGKGTISKAVANYFSFAHLDTGLLYRAVGMKALESGGLDAASAVQAARSLSDDDIKRSDLRTATAAEAASKIAVLPEVRAALLEYQRAFARCDGGAVLDGRDIGTVVCPDAEVKLYVTATAETRAQRRFQELQEAGQVTTFAEVLADVKLRDERDADRSYAPMMQSDDAILLDTTNLSIAEALSKVQPVISLRLASVE